MKNCKPLRVLVVDDTIVYRKIVGDVLSELPDVEVVGSANNGKTALARIAQLKPDIITLDIEMPEMNGLEVLDQLRRESPDVGAVMLSTLTHAGGDLTIKALELGAFDFIPKPDAGSMTENRRSVKESLAPILKAFRRHQEIKNILRGRGSKSDSPPDKMEPKAYPKTSPGFSRRQDSTRQHLSRVVAIGISTGGPNALARIMPQFPAGFASPILIVQHMPPIFTQSLARSLDSKSAIDVHEARDGETLEPSTALIAPGGRQMKIVPAPEGKCLVRITDDPPENSCKPSADYLFRSVAQTFGSQATGVIMTGMGQDGTRGLVEMKRRGAYVIAQDEESSTVYGMPKEALEAGVTDLVVHLDQIASEIVKTVQAVR